MRNDPEGRGLKQQLPYPYNQDLSKVLRGLKRRALKFRARQANDPVTAAYLCAALRLVQRHLGPSPSRVRADTEDPDSIARPLLSFLSQRAVAEEVAHNPPPFPRVGSQRTMRDRWEPHFLRPHRGPGRRRGDSRLAAAPAANSAGRSRRRGPSDPPHRRQERPIIFGT